MSHWSRAPPTTSKHAGPKHSLTQSQNESQGLEDEADEAPPKKKKKKETADAAKKNLETCGVVGEGGRGRWVVAARGVQAALMKRQEAVPFLKVLVVFLYM